MQLFVLSVLLTAVVGEKFIGNLLDNNAPLDHDWIEIGSTVLTDDAWVEIETVGDGLNHNDDVDVSVFLSLPDYGGPTYNDGWPMVPKMNGRAQKTADGTYKFSATLVQPNDSYCPKLWWTPSPSGPVPMVWLVVEEGAYNVSDTMFVIDSGDITRDNSVFIKQDTPSLYHAKSVHNYTEGCDSGDPTAPCTYIEKDNGFDNTKPWLHLGSIQQLQTSVNKGPDGADQELYLSVRARHVFSDRIVLMLMTHSVWQNHSKTVTGELPYNENFTFPDYPLYERITTPETVSYFVWEKDLRLKCVSGLVIETSIRYREVTSQALHFSYFFNYAAAPALFGMLGTLNSVADSTVLRSFNRTVDGSSFITQEDQCTDEEMKHTTPESAFSMTIGFSEDVFGEEELTNCFIGIDKEEPCVYNILLIDTFGDGWGGNYFEVVIDGVATRYDVPCGSRSIEFSTTECEFFAQMKCDGECTTTWENYWSFTHHGIDYYGDHDSTLHVDDTIVTVTDPANVNPNAGVNACDQCRIAPPPGTAAALAAARAAAEAAAAAAANPTAMLIGPNVVVEGGGASPAGSAGAGQVMTLVVDTAVFFQLSAAGTASPITGVSFKAGGEGVNGADVYAVPGFPVDGMASVESLDGSFVVSSEMAEMILAGAVYCEVYTQEFPNGELRGQLVAAAVGTGFELLPGNEVPAVTSSAYGMLYLHRVMDGDNVGAILYNLIFSSPDSFSPGVTAVHFHAGAAGVNGGVIYDFGVTTQYTYPAQFTGIISDDASLSAIAANMGAIYVNVHTVQFISGEVRGQIDFSSSESGSDDDKSSGDDDNGKPKPKPIVPVVIELFESAVSVNGWYDNSGAVDTVSYEASERRRRLEEDPVSFNVPTILTYPKYTIANEWNTKLIHTGSICMQDGKRAAFERCEEKLPANGKFIFRATGWVPENDDDTWKFCGVEGTVGQELQFEMVKGKCVPGMLIDAPDLCSDGGSLLSMMGEVQFNGVFLTELSQYDSLLLENEIAELMGSVVAVSISSYKQTESGILVTFGVTVAAERYNVDATVVDNISPLVATLQDSLNRKLVNNLFLTTSAKLTSAGYPHSAVLDATQATLVSFTYVGVKYVSPLPADKVVSYPAYNKEVTTSSSSSSQFHVVASTVATVFGVAIFVAFVSMKIREYSVNGAKFEALPTASEHELVEEKLTPFDLGMETGQGNL
jgi:hypothetical protein